MQDLKLEEIRQSQSSISQEDIKSKISFLPPVPSFKEALIRKQGEPISIIAEVKARSPGRENVSSLDPSAVARDYVAGGAKAISVLTDQSWFGGSLETLKEVNETVSIPLLHKEFIVSEYQLLQGRVRGASASLILAYYFDEKELRQIVLDCKRIGLEPVVECSLEKELPRALSVNPDVLMINNRPIAALPEEPSDSYLQGNVTVTLDWWQRNEALRRWKEQPGHLLISASCIKSWEDIKVLMGVPCDACLIGNSAMTAPDRVAFLQSLIGNQQEIS
jgi:indole-3-glycerol phosphate synthase